MSFRKRFEENYISIYKETHNGRGYKIKYIYYAPWYVWNQSPVKLRLTKLLITGMFILSFIAFYFAAINNAVVINNRMMTFVMGIILCCYVIELSGLIQFVFAKNKMTKMVFENIDGTLRIFPVIRILMSGLSFLFCAANIKGREDNLGALAVGALFAMSMLISWYMLRLYVKLPVDIQNNPAIKELNCNQNQISK